MEIMKFEQWNTAPANEAGAIALQKSGISPLAALVLSSRGIDTGAAAADFLACGAELLHDPMLMQDMPLAVQRIEQALEQGETIAVFGDYDVDGITSTCLLTSYLKSRGGNVIAYIPDRLTEGYSLNTSALTRLRLKGAKLLITVDCGITSRKEAAFAKGIGMDVVITDHHECKDELPDAIAVVNPHRPDCPYPFKHLAGVGVALKLVLALTPESRRSAVLQEYVDLAAIGTVADVMDLRGENRAIVTLGLNQLAHTRRPGLEMLIQESGLADKTITSTSIGFTIAPRINAAGRMGCPEVAARLVLTEDRQEAAELAQQLCELNRERQLIEQDIYTQCLEILEQQPELAEGAIVLAGDQWHQGVVGIVASRLTEKFSAPAFMICLDGGKGKGSCRSFGGFNLFHALEQCEDLLEGFGGHELAAGFTILEENIAPFRAKMSRLMLEYAAEHQIKSTLKVDAQLQDASLLTLNNVDDLTNLEPFGTGNPQPVFSLTGVTVNTITPVGKGRHTRLRISQGDLHFDAILFSCPPEETGLTAGGRADLAFNAQINVFRSNRSVQLTIVDWRAAPSLSQLDKMLYERWKQGDQFTVQELSLLVPERRDFVAVWRYLSAHAASNLFQESPARLAKNIARSAGQWEPYSRTMICLEVLQERGLICFTHQSNQLQIRIQPTRNKVDLEASHIMRALRSMLEF
jgi:single-stranded-DNA-specific exonuclease